MDKWKVHMNDFISTVRTDRQREINMKEESGIVVSDKYRYRIVDTIMVIMPDGTKLTYGFQANHRDVYFFMIDEGANSYFSIVEIYELLQKICDMGNADIVLDVLERIKSTEMKQILDPSAPTDFSKAKWENRGDFIYRGITYHMKMIDYPDYNGCIEMFDGGRTMSYKQLFVLLNLIQEKSNAFFMRGEVKNESLTNGIMRLFICLLKGTQDYDELKRLGWLYDSKNRKYVFDENTIEKSSRKYYLTENEFLSIIKSES